MIPSKVVPQSKTKKLTMIWSNRHIIKGPYDDNSLVSLWNRYINILNSNIEFITPMIGKYINNRLNYAVFENYGIDYNSYTIRNKESFNIFPEYDIIDKSQSNIVKITDDLKNFNLLSDDVYNRIIASLVKLYIIGVGELSFENVIFDRTTKQIYIIDVERNRNSHTISEGKFFFFEVPPNKNMQRDYDAKTVYKIVSEDMGENEEIRKLLGLDEKKYSANLEKIGTPYNSISRNGHSLSVLKSGLQKYIRRGDLQKALFCFYEMYGMGTRGKAIMTNLCNRIGIMSCEDIGPANPTLVNSVCKLIQEKNREFNKLYSVVVLLAKSKKTRAYSWINNYARNNSKYMLSVKELVKGSFESLKSKDLVQSIVYLTSLAKKMENYKLSKNGNIITVKEKDDKEDDVKIDLEEYKTTSKGERRVVGEMLAWFILRPFLGENLYTILSRLYTDASGTDRRTYLHHAAYISIHNERKIEEISDMKDAPLESDIVNGKYESIRKLDSFVYDMHTGFIAKDEKGKKKFKTEGSIVLNEDMKFRDKYSKYYDEYVNDF